MESDFLTSSAVAAAGVIGPAVVGLLGWYFRARVEEYRRARERLDESRVELYVEILDPYIRLLNKDKSQEQKAMKQILSHEYRSRSYQLMLLGDDSVARGYIDFMEYSFKHAGTNQDPKEALRHVGKFMLILRRGLGNHKTKLDEIDMLRWTIKDIHKILDPVGESPGH